MRPSEALAAHRDDVLAILDRYNASNPRLFGSVARGEDLDGSDIDILIDDESPMSTFELAGLELELEAILKTPVDLRLPGELSREVAMRMAGDLRPL